jgi:Ribonuclease G/E
LSLIKASLRGPLQNFLTGALVYREYRQGFEQNLAEILQRRLSQEQAQELAHRCARSEQDAIKEVEIILQAAGLEMSKILDQALADRAKVLTQEYGRGEARAIKQVTKVLAESGRTMDDLIAIAVNDKTGYGSDHDHLTILERIDHLTTVAETRRNVMLREIDRRRAMLGEALRRQVQEVEGEFEVVEKTPAATKSAA